MKKRKEKSQEPGEFSLAKLGMGLGHQDLFPCPFPSPIRCLSPGLPSAGCGQGMDQVLSA